jgi:hypothetical protein
MRYRSLYKGLAEASTPGDDAEDAQRELDEEEARQERMLERYEDGDDEERA